MKQWVYNNPQFECDQYNKDLLKYAPWSGHRNFVYDLVRYYEPKVIVELGSHYGCSAFTFCQAVKDAGLETKLNFVDTWQGDDFTSKYNDDVYNIFMRTINDFYQNQDTNVMRMFFDEAVTQFEDKSIDILHIDGSHHFDDIKRDFDTWYPKVKDNGIIMLHDTSSDIVLGAEMGSYKYWLELQKAFKNTISFDFSWGLGVIFLSEDVYNEFLSVVDLNKYQRLNNALDIEFKDELRKRYFQLIDNKTYIEDLKSQIDKLKLEIVNIQKSYENTNTKVADDYKKTQDKIIEDFTKTIMGKDEYINSIEEIKNRLEVEINSLEENITILQYEGGANNRRHESKMRRRAYIRKVYHKLRSFFNRKGK